MEASDLALWRFSVIGPLLHAAPGTSLAELARSLVFEPKVGPTGDPILVSADTLLRWYRSYRALGLAGLARRPRRDRGTRKALPKEAIEKLLALAEEHPEWTVCLIHRETQKTLGRRISVSAAYRLLAGHRRRARATGNTPRRPVGVPQTLWLADTMHGPFVWGPKRTRRKSYLPSTRCARSG